jgi:hypothetical protein
MPLSEAYLPAGHAVQDKALLLKENLPGKQASQTGEASCSANFPAVHA